MLKLQNSIRVPCSREGKVLLAVAGVLIQRQYQPGQGAAMIRDLLLTSALVTATVPPAPNIVLVTVEDLAWGDVSWHNPEVIMPNIATLASTGVILESAYVQPSSGSSQASLLTGKYPSRWASD